MDSETLNLKGMTLLITHGKRTCVIRHNEIIYIKADGNYSQIKLINASQFSVCRNLKEFQYLLESSCFFRCQKSYIVNISYIKEIIKGKKSWLLMVNGETIPLARRKFSALRLLFKPNLYNTVNTINNTVYT